MDDLDRGELAVNADLRVGGLEETITVSGETPVVDVQSATGRSSISGEVISEIPSARLYHSIVALVPGVVTSGPPDVGGADGPVFKLFSIHGGRGNEGQVQVDGMSTGAALNGGGVSYYVPDVGTSQEVEVRLTGGTAETERGGPVMSVVPRTGGNRFSGMYFTSGASGRWQSDNLTEEMREAIGVAGELRSVWDVNAAAGGPILRDRLWFYATGRHHGNRRYVTGMYLNKNAGNPNAWTYEPDLTRRATDGGTWMNSSVRLTLQADARNKVNIFWDEQWTCSSGCVRGSVTGGTATTSPEAHQPTMSYPSKVQQVTWTSAATGRLLLEAGYGNYLARWGGPERPDNNPDMIRAQEQSGPIPGITYRSQNWSRHWNGQHNWRASASYITGTHNMKVGYQGQYMSIDLTDFWNNHQVWYRFNNGQPNRVTMTAGPATTYNRAQSLALYAQDQWTRGRLTVQGGVRYDRATSHFPEQQVGPSRFVPQAYVLSETDGVKFNDITFRGAVAYDLFGTGRTAIKGSIGEYLEAVQNSGRYVQSNPRSLVVTSAFRSWTDSNGNVVPDCDLHNPAAQNLTAQGGDICGGWSNLLFGSSTQGTEWNPALLSGWGVRPNDWAIGIGVQHEFAPRASVEVSYNRRWFPTRNFTVTDNRAIDNDDFDSYSITAPLDPRLPDGGGYVIDDLWDIKPEMFGVESDNYVTSASDFGKQIDRWHGVDVNVNVRMRNGVRLQGGTSTGRRITDDCEILPDSPSRRACRVVEPFNTQVRALGSYTIPTIDVLVSGTFQSNPAPSRNANMIVPAGPGSELQASLGRPLASGANTITINLVEPWQIRGDRVNQVDFRVAKVLRFAGRRAMVSLDLYNALNANPILNQTQTYGSAWLNPTSVMDARFARLSAQIDF